MNTRAWSSLPIVVVMLVGLWGSAAFAADGVTCPAGDFSLFNTNRVGCTFCADNSDTCHIACLGPPACFCPPGDVACCAASSPCCENCAGSGSLECNLNRCDCEPADCCSTLCPAPPAVAPALGAPNSTPFGVAAVGLAIAGVLLIRRRRQSH